MKRLALIAVLALAALTLPAGSFGVSWADTDGPPTTSGDGGGGGGGH